MRPTGWRSLGSSAAWCGALMTAGAAVLSGCWLDRGIIDIPVVQDAGPPIEQDAGPSIEQDGASASETGSIGQDGPTPFETAPGGCQWVANTATGCTLTSVSCNQVTACPPSWMQANSPGSCPAAGTAIRTETCDGMNRWNLDTSDGTLIGVCYYDMSNGLLAGIDWQGQLPCGSTANRFGMIPQLCHYDAGIAVHRYTCAAAGSGAE